MTFTFKDGSMEFVATLWNKVPGKECYYVKYKGLDFAVVSFDGTDASKKKGAWANKNHKSEFLAAFNEALKAEQEVEAAIPAAEIAQLNSMMGAPAKAAEIGPDHRQCASCGCWVTRREVRANGGDWSDLGTVECGC